MGFCLNLTLPGFREVSQLTHEADHDLYASSCSTISVCVWLMGPGKPLHLPASQPSHFTEFVLMLTTAATALMQRKSISDGIKPHLSENKIQPDIFSKNK